MGLAFSSIIALLFIFPAITMAETVIWKEDVSGWDIRVDPTIGNACFMLADFEEGSFVRLQLVPEEEKLQFIIGNGAWKSLEEGKFYPMSVQFGRRSPWNGDGVGYWWGRETPSLILDVPLFENRASDFADEFMRMTEVTVSYEDRVISRLSLRGTFAGFQELLGCQAAMFEGTSSSGTDPFQSNGQSSSRDPFN